MVFHDSLRARTVDQTSIPSPQELHSRYLDDVLRYASSFVHPLADAEDVTMEVFHAAFRCSHKLRNKEDPRVWLLGIARRKVADLLRRRYRRQETPLEDATNLSKMQQGSFERTVLVRSVLSELPHDQREALVLKYVNGLTTIEVAHVLNRSEVATNSLLQRARDAFYTKGASLFLDDSEVDHV